MLFCKTILPYATQSIAPVTDNGSPLNRHCRSRRTHLLQLVAGGILCVFMLLLSVFQARTGLMVQETDIDTPLGAKRQYQHKQLRSNGLSSILYEFEENITHEDRMLKVLDEKTTSNATSDHSAKPFLIVCTNINPALVPMFSNFNLVRLSKNETPPSWSSLAFLESSGCENHAYVKEAFERRQKSPFLVGRKMTTDENGTWLHGVHWPNFSSNSTKYIRQVKDRPVILGLWGEVFWRTLYGSCSHVDIVVYRSTEHNGKDCLTMHFLQGVSTSLGATDELEQESKTITGGKHEKFCSMIVKYNSSEPTKMFQSVLYDIDAIIRHMFFLQLSEYKPCERILDCPGNPYVSFKCMEGYKFHITMENTQVDGYVSEKLFNGARAGGIPIYFGARDIEKYFNPKSFVHCAVSREVVEVMRSFYPRGQKPRPFLFKNSSRPTDEELIIWADHHLRKQLDPCVKRVIELDNNEDMYRAVLREPFIINPDIMSGVYPMRGVALAYSLLVNSPNTWFETYVAP